MKRPLLYFVSIMLLMSSCAYQQIGDLTMISNRNVDSGQEYVLIQRNSKGVAKMKSNNALELAVDAAAEAYKGEYLMNVKVYVKNNGKKIKVEGDVWGMKSIPVHSESSAQVIVESSINNQIEFITGDAVVFKSFGKLMEGKIVGINANRAVVEFVNTLKEETKKEISFEELTKINK
jgi:hypothetical protein